MSLYHFRFDYLLHTHTYPPKKPNKKRSFRSSRAPRSRSMGVSDIDQSRADHTPRVFHAGFASASDAASDDDFGAAVIISGPSCVYCITELYRYAGC